MPPREVYVPVLGRNEDSLSAVVYAVQALEKEVAILSQRSADDVAIREEQRRQLKTSQENVAALERYYGSLENELQAEKLLREGWPVTWTARLDNLEQRISDDVKDLGSRTCNLEEKVVNVAPVSRQWQVKVEAACAKVQHLSRLLEDYAAKQCSDEYIIDMLTNMAEILGRSSELRYKLECRISSTDDSYLKRRDLARALQDCLDAMDDPYLQRSELQDFLMNAASEKLRSDHRGLASTPGKPHLLTAPVRPVADRGLERVRDAWQRWEPASPARSIDLYAEEVAAEVEPGSRSLLWPPSPPSSVHASYRQGGVPDRVSTPSPSRFAHRLPLSNKRTQDLTRSSLLSSSFSPLRSSTDRYPKHTPPLAAQELASHRTDHGSMPRSSSLSSDRFLDASHDEDDDSEASLPPSPTTASAPAFVLAHDDEPASTSPSAAGAGSEHPAQASIARDAPSSRERASRISASNGSMPRSSSLSSDRSLDASHDEDDDAEASLLPSPTTASAPAFVLAHDDEPASTSPSAADAESEHPVRASIAREPDLLRTNSLSAAPFSLSLSAPVDLWRTWLFQYGHLNQTGVSSSFRFTFCLTHLVADYILLCEFRSSDRTPSQLQLATDWLLLPVSPRSSPHEDALVIFAYKPVSSHQHPANITIDGVNSSTTPSRTGLVGAVTNTKALSLEDVREYCKSVELKCSELDARIVLIERVCRELFPPFAVLALAVGSGLPALICHAGATVALAVTLIASAKHRYPWWYTMYSVLSFTLVAFGPIVFLLQCGIAKISELFPEPGPIDYSTYSYP